MLRIPTDTSIMTTPKEFWIEVNRVRAVSAQVIGSFVDEDKKTIFSDNVAMALVACVKLLMGLVRAKSIQLVDVASNDMIAKAAAVPDNYDAEFTDLSGVDGAQLFKNTKKAEAKALNFAFRGYHQACQDQASVWSSCGGASEGPGLASGRY